MFHQVKFVFAHSAHAPEYEKCHAAAQLIVLPQKFAPRLISSNDRPEPCWCTRFARLSFAQALGKTMGG
jgi:hypothetical protein